VKIGSGGTGLETFQTTFRLLAGSASNARDNLRAFLFAFTALEVFVGKFSNQVWDTTGSADGKGPLTEDSRASRTITTRGKGART
jgi:hypothetical protein